MRLVRICISVTGLAVGSLVLNPSLAGAVSPCAPGQPTGRPPGQPAGRPPQYPPGKCQLQLAAASATPRSSVDVGGSGFAPRSTVSVFVGSTQVGTATTDAEGRFNQAFVIPADMAPGQTDVRATGLGTSGSPYEQSATFEVLAPANPAAVVAGTPGLRSGAGLAAAPQGGFLSGAPLAGGGPTVLSGSRGGNSSGGIAAGTGRGGGAGAQLGTGTAGPSGSSTEQAAALRANGNGAVGARISIAATGAALDRLNPLLLVGGGLALAGIGAATVVAAKRRKPDEG